MSGGRRSAGGRGVVLALAIGLALGAARPATAQDEGAPTTRLVEIVNADSVAGVVENGQRVRRLIGDVVLRQEDTRLRARRATQLLDLDVTIFEGDVEIVEEGDTLTARLVRYNAATKVGQAEGDVRIADSSAVLFAPTATYDTRAKLTYFTEGARLVEDDAELTSRRGSYDSRARLATFTDDVRLTDSTTVLTSRRGTYNTQTRRADFAGDVRLEHPDTYLEADSVVHFRDTALSEAHGRVFIERFGAEDPDAPDSNASEASGSEGEDGAPLADGAAPDSVARRDSTLRTLLFGDRALHDETRGFSRLEGRPLLATLRTDSTGATDTLLVRARILEAYRLSPAALDSMEASAERPTRRVERGGPVDSAAVSGAAVDSAAVSGAAVGADSVAVGEPPSEADASGERAPTGSVATALDGQPRDPPPRATEPKAADSIAALSDSPAAGSLAAAPDSLVADSLAADTTAARPSASAGATTSDFGLRPSAFDLPPSAEVTRLVARDAVQIVQPDLVAAADSAVLDRFELPAPEGAEPETTDLLRLFRTPAVWFAETQITGDTLAAVARDDALDTLLVTGRAFAAQRDTTLDRVNQIRGRTMLALFEASELRRLLVWPNAEALYFRAKPAPEGAPRPADPAERLDGAVQLSADSIAFAIADDTLRAVRAYRGIEGQSFAADIVPAGLRLDGFVYTPERRPTQAGLLPAGSREAVRLGRSDSLAAPRFDIPDVDAARDSVGARLDSLDADQVRLDSLQQDSLRQAPVEIKPPPAERPSLQGGGPPSDRAPGRQAPGREGGAESAAVPDRRRAPGAARITRRR